MKNAAPAARIRRHKELGPMHDLLLKACPPDPNHGAKSITVLAKALDMTPWGIFKWIKAGRIPAGQAKRIVELRPENDRLVSLREFDRFVYAD